MLLANHYCLTACLLFINQNFLTKLEFVKFDHLILWEAEQTKNIGMDLSRDVH